MARQDEARNETQPWLEQVAWNAAALAVVAAMLLVLLGSIEWLDRVTPAPASPSAPRSARAVERPARGPVVVTGVIGRVRRGTSAVGDAENCAAPARGSG